MFTNAVVNTLPQHYHYHHLDINNQSTASVCHTPMHRAAVVPHDHTECARITVFTVSPAQNLPETYKKYTRVQNNSHGGTVVTRFIYFYVKQNCHTSTQYGRIL